MSEFRAKASDRIVRAAGAFAGDYRGKPGVAREQRARAIRVSVGDPVRKSRRKPPAPR